MKINQIQEIVLNKLNDFINENEIEIKDFNFETRLIGSSGIFDSMDLVSFIVELEEEIEDKLQVELILADERAMSRTTSPFINSVTLSKYILELIENE
jgi:acyl carrier protein